MSSQNIDSFWAACLQQFPDLSPAAPQAWAFGATPEHADSLLALVLEGKKTATASSVWDYEHAREALPQPGTLNIILDGRGCPQALLETTHTEVVPFNEVSAAHAFEEGEGDRSLEYWRAAHERYWREHAEDPRGFSLQMLILCERFRVLFPTT